MFGVHREVYRGGYYTLLLTFIVLIKYILILLKRHSTDLIFDDPVAYENRCMTSVVPEKLGQVSERNIIEVIRKKECKKERM